MFKIFKNMIRYLLIFLLVIPLFLIQISSEQVMIIYINPDGTFDPPYAPLKVEDNIYILTREIKGRFIIQRSGIVLDGSNYTLNGINEFGFYGIELRKVKNIEIKNFKIKDFDIGIYIESSNNVLIKNTFIFNSNIGLKIVNSQKLNFIFNNIYDNKYGIYIEESFNNMFKNNLVFNNDFGVMIVYSEDNVFLNNSLKNDSFFIEMSFKNQFINNTVNDKQLLYLENVKDKVIENLELGQLIVLNSKNLTIKNILIKNSEVGIFAYNLTSSKIFKNKLFENKFTAIYMENSSNNLIFINEINNNLHGINLRNSLNNTLFNNFISKNDVGIYFEFSSNNTIMNNTFQENIKGIYLFKSYNNHIYHNNFIKNKLHAETKGSRNIWNKNYPEGGNYWSNFNCTDTKKGENQDIDGSDGICDIPFVIDNFNIDKYPIVNEIKFVKEEINKTTYFESPKDKTEANFKEADQFLIYLVITVVATAIFIYIMFRRFKKR